MKINHSLAFLLLLSPAYMQATILSNRTYVRARDTLSHNLILELTGRSWAGKDALNSRLLGTTLSAAPYYRRSHNAYDLARAFGGGQAVDGNQVGTLSIQPGEATTTQQDALTLYSAAIDHLGAPGTTGGMFGTISFNPVRTESGVHFTLRQPLHAFLPHLSLVVELPVVSASHDLRATFKSIAHSETTYGQQGTTLQGYFAGATLSKTTSAKQNPLQYALIDGKAHRTVAIADLQIGLSYGAYFYERGMINVGVYGIVPTNKDLNGTYLFQPVVGSHHRAIGATVHSIHRLATFDNDTSLDLIGYANYRHAFQGTETRTLGIYSWWYSGMLTGSQYRNVATAGATSATPAANVLTRPVFVSPGEQLDLIIGGRLQYRDFKIHGYYNLHAHTEETVRLPQSSKWFDMTYGLLAQGSPVNNGIVVGADTNIDTPLAGTFGGPVQQEGNIGTVANDSRGTGHAITDQNNYAQTYISTKACLGRSDITHKLALVGDWAWRNNRFPVTVSSGAECEFAARTNDNSGIHSWALWIKGSFTF